MVVGRERSVAFIFRGGGADADRGRERTSEGECLDLGMRGPAELYTWCDDGARVCRQLVKLFFGFRGRL